MDFTANSSVIENELHGQVEDDGGDGSNENVIKLKKEVKIIEDNVRLQQQQQQRSSSSSSSSSSSNNNSKTTTRPLLSAQ